MVEEGPGEEGVGWEEGGAEVGGRAAVEEEEGLGESWLHCWGVEMGISCANGDV